MKSQGDAQHESRSRAPDGRASGNRRANVAALIAVAVLVALLLWVSQAILAHNRLQNCIDSGRHDCIPAEKSGS